MQQTTVPKRTRRREPKSCTECRRRKQKCNPRKEGGPCGNCLRRYPPVACVGRAEPSKKPDPTPAQDPVPRPHIDEYSRGFLPSTSESHDPRPQPDSSLSDVSRSPSHLSSVSPAIAGIVDHDVSSYFPSTYIDVGNSSDLVLPSNSTPPKSPEEASYGSPRNFGGILTSINTLYSLPIKQTSRNAELLHFFHGYVVPNLVSIDGKNVPPLFLREMLPWMIQSPLMPNIAIMMASATQSSEQQLMVRKSSETLSIQSHVFKIINEVLKQDFSQVGGEALRAVIHLAILEFFWGSPEMLWLHVEGLNQMIKLRGGYTQMKDPVLEQVFILTDYELACCFECDLTLQNLNPNRDMEPPIPACDSEALTSPFLSYPTTFVQIRETLSLSLAVAQILDDIRFLTLSITSQDSQSSTSKIQSTASWLHKQLELIPIPSTPYPTEFDLFLIIIHSTALTYTKCISTLSPFTNAYTSASLHALLSQIWLIPLSKWKEIPGIFLWVLLVACPSAGNIDELQGRWLKKKMAVTGMTIGMSDFGLAIAGLRAFWKVQRWIRREREIGVIDPFILKE